MISKNDPNLLAYRAERDPKRKRRLADKLVRENMALVHRLVGKFARWAPDGIEQDDLVQAGLIAFLYAIDNIDTSKTFSTYYAYRVWYEVSKCCEKAGLIYKPRGCGMPYKVLQQIEKFQTRFGRTPSAEEIGVPQSKMDAWASLPTVISLDTEVAEGTTLHDAIADSRPGPDSDAEEDQEKESVRTAMLALPEGQRKVLDLIYLQGRSLQQTAELLKMPVAYVESTRDAGLTKMRERLE